MGDLDIVFKQTTSDRVKCKVCRSSVSGEDGYIKIYVYQSYLYPDRTIVLCNDCFKEYMDKITTATENKKELYSKMVKTKILRSLR